MSSRPPKPGNMTWIAPILTVRDADIALEFYEKAFGFEKSFAMPGPNGKTMHAEMRWNDSMFMLGPECTENPCKAPVTLGVRPSLSLYVYCDDVDAAYQRALAAGAVSESAPQDMFWGDRVCTILDPEGYLWHFATNVKDFVPNPAE